MRRTELLPYGAGILIACAVLLLVQWKLDFHWGERALASRTGSVTAGGPAAPGAAGGASVGGVSHGVGPTSTLTLEEHLKVEAGRVGAVTANPAQEEEKLNQWGQSLTAADIQKLRDVAFLGEHGGDEVALAIDLLGRSNLPEAADVLVDYVLQGPPVSAQEQSTFQLLALEGLIDRSTRLHDTSYLKRIEKESSDALVARRAKQAIGAIAGQNPSVQETDDKALEELLERSSR